MANVLIALFCFYEYALHAAACRDTLWFQASNLASTEDLTTGRFHLQASTRHEDMALLQLNSRAVSDAAECSRLCYETMASICGSALFEQQSQLGPNWCRLMPWNFPCAIGRHLVSSVDQPGAVVLLHCFYCNRFAGGSLEQEAQFAIDDATGGSEFVLTTTTTTTTADPVGRFQEFSIEDRSPPGTTTTKLIRVMTFNTWISGSNVRDGVTKIARHILINDPHIVALQEMDEYTANRIRNALNSYYQRDPRQYATWYHCRRNEGGLNHVLTRLPIHQEYMPSAYLKNNGCQLKVHNQPSQYMQIWNVHLHWEDYGPYAACDKAKASSRSVEDLLFYSEYKPRDTGRSRLHQTLRFLHNRQLKDFVSARSNASPFMVVLGDFNSPSHLDWTNAASFLHCNVSYDWPVSKLMSDSGFVDSFRKVNDDPVREPGTTWSPIYRTKSWISTSSTEVEPQDRIDFIYYLSGNPWLTVRRSVVYKGDRGLGLFPYHSDNDWPSDHAAVVTDFELVIA